ncbi:MAG: cell division protein FtsQ/DivIB [Deltaproteobacteria bacterium]|nr:cell division protein FtsQ/DivIB [Deltaproteobacteria bacterium]
MSALPTPSRPNRRPGETVRARQTPQLRPEARGAAATAPPRRVATQPRLAALPRPGVGRALKGALLVGVAAASAFGVVTIADVVERSPSLPLHNVSVVAAGGGVLASARDSEVKAYAELVEGVPFFGIDTDEVKARVERHPFIREALVRRLPPDTIEIVVQERVARAVVSTPQGMYLLDDDGEVMKRARPGDDVDVPVLSGFVSAASSDLEPSKLGGALALLRAIDKAGIGARVSEIVALPATGFELVLVDGARVRVGDTDFDARLQRLGATEQRLAASGRHFSFMWLDDARHPERVAVRLRSTTETSSTGG